MPLLADVVAVPSAPAEQVADAPETPDTSVSVSVVTAIVTTVHKLVSPTISRAGVVDVS